MHQKTFKKESGTEPKEEQNQAGSHVGYERGFFHNSRDMRSCTEVEYRWYIPPDKCTAYR